MSASKRPRSGRPLAAAVGSDAQAGCANVAGGLLLRSSAASCAVAVRTSRLWQCWPPPSPAPGGPRDRPRLQGSECLVCRRNRVPRHRLKSMARQMPWFRLVLATLLLALPMELPLSTASFDPSTAGSSPDRQAADPSLSGQPSARRARLRPAHRRPMCRARADQTEPHVPAVGSSNVLLQLMRMNLMKPAVPGVVQHWQQTSTERTWLRP